MKILAIALAGVVSVGATAFAAETQKADNRSVVEKMKPMSKSEEATAHIQKSIDTLKKMEADSSLKDVLKNARGIFVVPDYGRVATGVIGGQGGAGVVLVKQGTTWSDPAFYNLGGLSGGIQAGIEAGEIAFILNNDKAVKSFMENNKFSLDADAGLTVVNWSKKGATSGGHGDVIAWSDTEGVFGSLAVGVNDVEFDDQESAALYGKKVTAKDILSGKAKAPAQKVAALKKALPAGGEMSATGKTSTPSED